MLRSSRIWWTAGALIIVLIFALLAAIAGQQTPVGPSSYLAIGESETLRACVVEVVLAEYSHPFEKIDPPARSVVEP